MTADLLTTARAVQILDAVAPEGWALADVSVSELGAVLLDITRAAGPAQVRVGVMPGGSSEPIARTVGGDLWLMDSAGIAQEVVSDVVREVARRADAWALPLAGLFPHLIVADTRADATTRRERVARLLDLRLPWVPEPLQRRLPDSAEVIVLDPPGITAWLEPEVILGGPPIADHVLRSVYVPPAVQRSGIELRRALLEFRRASGPEVVRITLGLADAVQPAFGVAGSLAIGFEARSQWTPTSVAEGSLASWIVALASLKVDAATRLRVPERTREVRALSVPARTGAYAVEAPTSRDTTLHLQIDAECQQACVFCPIKAYFPPWDGGAAELEAMRLRLRAARELGIDCVQINGIDPLAFSHVLELVSEVTSQGFRVLRMMGPARRFGDLAFRRAFFARAPKQTFVVVPIYGATAAVHEAVTNLPGSHAQAMAALDGLIADIGRRRVRVQTVLTRKNTHEWAQMVALCRGRGVGLSAGLPYPLERSASGVYEASAVTETEASAALLGALDVWDLVQGVARLGAIVRHPCVLRRVALERAPWLVPALVKIPRQRPALTGGFTNEDGSAVAPPPNADPTFLRPRTVPCPEAHRCALADACPGEHYAVYEELFGLGEFVAVSAEELGRPSSRAP